MRIRKIKILNKERELIRVPRTTDMSEAAIPIYLVSNYSRKGEGRG